MAKAHVLVADDHEEMAKLLADQLRDVGYTVDVVTSGAQALARVAERLPDVVITDLRMEGQDGFDVLDGIAAIDASIPVLIMTAFGAIDTAVKAIKRGAYHYLTKPFQLQEVLVYVDRALSERRLRDENRSLRRLATTKSGLGAMVGSSQVMRELYQLIERVAVTHVPVLIRGESGTGKELVARALHLASPRQSKSFVPVNCTALPEQLLESELFGHVRGAFTGASGTRRGLFLEADGGTLFLDEIADMPANLQARLLRVLEDGEVRAVGSDSTRKVDVRLIAATHQPIEERIESGAFRSDLFYRLNVVPIEVPPLRERVEDIPALVAHFLGKARETSPALEVRAFSPEALALLAGHTWPGNVRELENLVKRLAILGSAETIEVSHLEQVMPTLVPGATPLDRARVDPMSLRDLETEYIAWVIERCGGNKTRAAQILGIDVSTIHRRGRRS